MKCKDMGKLWEEFNIKNAMAIAVTRSLNGRFDSTKDFSVVNMQNSMPGSMLAASIARASSTPSLLSPYHEIKLMCNNTKEIESIGYFCIADNTPGIPIMEINSLSHCDYDGDTVGPLKKVRRSMIREQIGFVNAFTNPYINDHFKSKEKKILDVFNSRLKLIRDNKIHILKK